MLRQRGRRSSVALEFLPPEGKDQGYGRPTPPIRLTPEQAEVWWEVVNGLRADWFGPENLAMLEVYCGLVVRQRLASQEVNQLEAEGRTGDPAYGRYLTRELQIANGLLALATKMRLTQQSKYDRKTAYKPKVSAVFGSTEEGQG